MTTPLPTRAGQLVRLLSSDQVGEAGAAAQALHRVIRVAGRDIFWLADLVETALANGPTLVPLDDDCSDWKSVALFCRQHRDLLNEKEAKFVEAIWRWRGEPSERQLQWLRDIYARVAGEG